MKITELSALIGIFFILEDPTCPRNRQKDLLELI
jgi:hypothetical protein